MASSGPDQSGRNVSSIPDPLEHEVNEAYKKRGIPGLKEAVERKLNLWKTVPLNIAITGDSGAGKSCYINALRGMTADDKEAAPVGVVQTTAEVKQYPHPEHKNLILWDLPGVGTPEFTRDSYLAKTNFERYDFFLVFTSCRFTENDMWLAQQIRQTGKSFYFIRTKIDSDISNNKQSHPRTHSRVQVLHTVRSDCMNQLQNKGFTNPEVFIISNFDVNEFDFGQLSERLIQDAPDIKREALTLSLTILTENIIRAKESYLRKRIFIVSIASAAAAAVPIPGVEYVVDTAILLKETEFYRKQLRLDNTSVQENAAALNISLSELQKRLNLESQTIPGTARGLLAFFVSLQLSTIAKTVLKVALPFVSWKISSGLSYGVQVFCLNNILDIMVNDALRINAAMNIVFARNTMEVIQRT
ncbi:T-cell-specific guanine nucleotide triphosphate-binding protein 2-like [Mercenaria mercenaria]|uniref:T-cell-specific guanine nucleotide triphosphate-binding protein 2-like n=1 Tax=Mercenaria mercenaria TaxID=6596 RepID=UPI00234F3CA1|nr:T-cell-specific guanine nucleotide triphosphate-binding protein 2-like [Mercenaria mercenaria]